MRDNNYSNFTDAYKGNRFSTKQTLDISRYEPLDAALNSGISDNSGSGYQSFANFSSAPPQFGKSQNTAYYDRGSGIPKIKETNMTIQDIYRTPFLFTQEHRKNYKNMATAALKGVQCTGDLSKTFFSDENFKRLQRMIKKEIFNRTKGQFKLDIDQEQRDMFIVMRAIYMEHARFLPGQIIRQVKRLNQKVVEEIVPGMITEIRQHWGYLKEINKPLSPIDRPINVSNAGRRTLPSITTTWGVQ